MQRRAMPKPCRGLGSGGWAILRHSKVAKGAPSQGLADSRVAIRPFSDWNGRRFCELDWHVILIADIEPVDDTSSRQDAKAAAENLIVSMTLDGAPLPLTRTAVKRFLNPERFDLEDAVFAQWGHIMWLYAAKRGSRPRIGVAVGVCQVTPQCRRRRSR
jgi:hypothetical protein